MKKTARSTGILVLLAVALLVAASCSSDDSDSASDESTTTEASEDAATTTAAADDESTTTAAADDESTTTAAADDAATAGDLSGLLTVIAGECADGAVTAGSSFRMVESGGTVEDGPFIDNADSACGDTTWSSLAPGTANGLMTGEYQPAPDPAFDEGGNGLADQIIEPVTFFAVGFAMSTEEVDPLSSAATPAPTLAVDDAGAVTGDLSSVLVSWNGQQFNQGSPKPDGSATGGTTPVTGTYDAASGEYTLDWTSQISGGPFDGFTGVWHLEGALEAS